MINVYVIYSQFTVAGAVAYPCEFLFLFHWKEKGLLVNKRLSRYGETLVELNCSWTRNARKSGMKITMEMAGLFVTVFHPQLTHTLWVSGSQFVSREERRKKVLPISDVKINTFSPLYVNFIHFYVLWSSKKKTDEWPLLQNRFILSI